MKELAEKNGGILYVKTFDGEILFLAVVRGVGVVVMVVVVVEVVFVVVVVVVVVDVVVLVVFVVVVEVVVVVVEVVDIVDVAVVRGLVVLCLWLVLIFPNIDLKEFRLRLGGNLYV